MDLTQGTEQEKLDRSKKMMLWFSMISMFMMFGGLISAYIVSRKRGDWLEDFSLPSAFFISTIVIVLSSVTFHLAKKAIQNNERQKTTVFLLITLGLAIVFVISQFIGFDQIIKTGYFFTGKESSITTTFLYILTVMHLAHIAAGIIVLLVVIYNHFKQKYKRGQTLGLELGAMFWHFLDVLWIILFLFLYFFA